MDASKSTELPTLRSLMSYKNGVLLTVYVRTSKLPEGISTMEIEGEKTETMPFGERIVIIYQRLLQRRFGTYWPDPKNHSSVVTRYSSYIAVQRIASDWR